jgi:hypothetical protein
MEDYSIVKKNKVVEERGRFYSSSLGYFQVIPEPIFNIIFSYFKDNINFEDKKNIRLTCKLFMRVINNYWVQRITFYNSETYFSKIKEGVILAPFNLDYNIKEETTPSDLSIDLTNILINKLSLNYIFDDSCLEYHFDLFKLKLPVSLKTLVFNNLRIDNQILESLPENLVKLRLNKCEFLTEKNIILPENLLDLQIYYAKSSILKKINLAKTKKLQKLIIGFCNFYDDMLNPLPNLINTFNNKFQFLKSLTIRDSAFITDDHMKDLPSTITYLNLENLSVLTEEGLKNLYNNLITLKLRNINITGKYFFLLSSNLQHLELIGCIYLANEYFKNIPKNTIYFKLFLNINRYVELRYLPSNVTNLILYYPNSILDHPKFNINCFFEYLPSSLIELNIYDGYFIDKFIKPLPLNLKSLIFKNSIINDDEFFKIPKNLTLLDISYNNNISDNGVINYLKDNSTLTELNISSTNISQRIFKFLPECLNTLSVYNCKNVSGDLNDIPKNLKKLNLNNTSITDESLKNLPNSLIELYLCNNRSITNKGIEYLPSTLRNLSITNCHQIIPEKIKNLSNKIIFIA